MAPGYFVYLNLSTPFTFASPNQEQILLSPYAQHAACVIILLTKQTLKNATQELVQH
jgi:hypothetical protein